MLQRIREAGPGLLVPLAWLFVALAERGIVASRSMFIAHLVMAAFITFFLLTGWSEMKSGALAGWRAVMVVGLGLTLAGIGGFLLGSTPLLATSLVGWMVLPVAGLVYTGRLCTAAAWLYVGSAAVATVGAVVYVGGMVGGSAAAVLVGIVLVGIGQTIGIVDAVLRF